MLTALVPVCSMCQVKKAGQAPIYQIWAEKKKKGKYFYHGAARAGPTSGRWEQLTTVWVEENFGPGAGYPTYLANVRANDGQPLVVPKGCADAAVDPPSQSSGVSDPAGASGASLSEARLSGALAPSVIHQGTRQHCSALGMASALAACGFADAAKLLESKADAIRDCTTSQAAAAVKLLVGAGGWERSEHLSYFDPLTDRSELPTIAQICGQIDGTEDANDHVVAFAGDFIYNSNWPEPRRISPHTLDACCGGEATYHHISYAVRFHPTKQLRKRARSALVAAEAERPSQHARLAP